MNHYRNYYIGQGNDQEKQATVQKHRHPNCFFHNSSKRVRLPLTQQPWEMASAREVTFTSSCRRWKDLLK